MTEMDELKPWPEKASPLPWTYHNRHDGTAFGARDWIEDANGSVVVESVGHIDGPAICEAVNRRPSLSPAGVTEEQVAAALRVRSAKFPHTIDTILGESGVIYPSQRDAVMRAALEAAAKVRSPDTGALREALKEVARLRLATDEGSLRERADRMWEVATAALEAAAKAQPSATSDGWQDISTARARPLPADAKGDA